MRANRIEKASTSVCVCVLLALLAGPFTPCSVIWAQRRISVGQEMPEFSATDVSGKLYEYKPGSSKVLLMVFLSAGQKRSDRAAADIENVVAAVAEAAEKLEVVAVIYGPNEGAFFSTGPEKSAKDFRVVNDAERKLWGKFGIIVTPTVVISGRDDKVLWIEPGHGHDFAPVVESHLKQALGIAQAIDPAQAGQVRTITHDTPSARAKRHLEMAKILLDKGRLSAAIAEVRKATEVDPNSPKPALQLGRLLCQAGQAEAALGVAGKIKATTKTERAQVVLILGWAKRQLGQLEAAERLLLEATTLDPRSGRAFFELGKLYHSRQQTDKAMQAYYRALLIVFGEQHQPGFLSNGNSK
ncbi:MAG: tetratricopeptide repeat protein [Planctomycetota bacterium]